MLVGDTWREDVVACSCCDGLVGLLLLMSEAKDFWEDG
jgi:hypothetical protein